MNYTLNYPDCSAAELILNVAERYPKLHAYSFLGFNTSYKRFAKQIRSSASALAAAGVVKGDRIMLCLPNVPLAMLAFYGANLLGAAVVFVHPLSSEGELEYYINDSKPKLIITMKMFRDKFKTEIPIITNLNKLRGIKVTSDAEPIDADAAAIMYSGGTTGSPKGIILSNFNFNSLAVQASASADCLEPGGKMLAIMPIFHGYGLGIGVHTALAEGCCIVLVPRFTSKSCAKLIKRINYFSGVPTLFEALLHEKSLNRADLSHLRGVFCGADTLSVELKQKFDAFLAERGAPVRLREGYGMTESVTATCLTPREPERERSGSVGLPYADTRYKTLDSGELCVRGPTVMLSYLNNPEETAQTLQIHDDGYEWLHTGDIGKIDDEGYVYFLGRIKRVIMTSGYSVFPLQIELALNSHELVKQSCVIGVPHPYKMQVPKAFITLNNGIRADKLIEAQLREHLEKNVAKYALPKEIVFLDSFPTTKLGKIDVKELEKL
ncbi:MAG: AMP-binding protein [Oscillospiraceae bacterium]|jgi:long-chain acyl-CoA synthetase|nr:AMP-binding protein [Oscillospiraceae bacterium]